jgi:hypothetical protein
MKRLVPLALALSLSVGGCAHSQSSRHTTARTVALTTAVIAGVVLATFVVPCAQCNDTFISTDGVRR